MIKSLLGTRSSLIIKEKRRYEISKLKRICCCCLKHQSEYYLNPNFCQKRKHSTNLSSIQRIEKFDPVSDPNYTFLKAVNSEDKNRFDFKQNSLRGINNFIIKIDEEEANLYRKESRHVWVDLSTLKNLIIQEKDEVSSFRLMQKYNFNQLITSNKASIRYTNLNSLKVFKKIVLLGELEFLKFLLTSYTKLLFSLKSYEELSKNEELDKISQKILMISSFWLQLNNSNKCLKNNMDVKDYKKLQNDETIECIVPDMDLYAILVNCFIKCKRNVVVKLLLREIDYNKHSFDVLLKNKYIENIHRPLVIKENGTYQVGNNYNNQLFDISQNHKNQSKDGNVNLDILKRSMLVLNTSNHKNMSKDIIHLYEKQINLETAVLDAAHERLLLKEEQLEKSNISSQFTNNKVKQLAKEWIDEMVPIIKRLKYLINHKAKFKEISNELDSNFDLKQYAQRIKPRNASNVINIISAEGLASVAITSILSFYNDVIKNGGVMLSMLYQILSNNIKSEYNAEQLRKPNIRKILINQQVELSKIIKDEKTIKSNLRKLYSKNNPINLYHNPINNKLENRDKWMINWSIEDLFIVSDFLLQTLIKVAKFYNKSTNKNISVFSNSYAFANGQRYGILSWDERFLMFVSSDFKSTTSCMKLLPMVVPPRPWLTYKDGGYLTINNLCMRTQGSLEQKILLKKCFENGKLQNVLSALDILSTTKWVINTKILDVIIEIKDTNISIANIPPIMDNNYPKKPTAPINNCENYEKELAKYKSELRDYNSTIKRLKKAYSENYSLRCDFNYKIEIAKTFRNNVIYFPYNLDFRGRTYPVPALFSHIGNDVCRGLLLFAEKKPLGENGLKWLKINLANFYGHGYDKSSFNNRIQFADENYEKVKNCAIDPIGSKDFWISAEEPFQFLACCFEIYQAISSGNAKDYLSGFPVHKDGTCNGLQHYAALGLDCEGSKKVNLWINCPLNQDPDDLYPQDVYSSVLEIVNNKINQAEESDEIAQIIKGKINRNIIKQTVMTNVYGVTQYGGKEQIKNKIRDTNLLNIDTEKPLNDIILNRISVYLASLVFKSLGSLFYNSQYIQKWFNQCAKVIASSISPRSYEILKDNKLKSTKKKGSSSPNNHSSNSEKSKSDVKDSKEITVLSTSVTWTTPLGLTVTQPYRKDEYIKIQSRNQVINVPIKNIVSPVNVRKQSAAFPPNFIHSLDSTHMMLTAIRMKQEGLEFASVHDSFWTHAGSVERMTEILKEQFVEMYKQPILENLREEFIKRYKDYKVRSDVINFKLDSDKNFDIKKKERNSTVKSSKDWVDIEFPSLPEKGNFDLNQVLKAHYFFH